MKPVIWFTWKIKKIARNLFYDISGKWWSCRNNLIFARKKCVRKCTLYAIWERSLRGNRKELGFFWRSHRGRFLSWEKGRPFGTGPKRVAIWFAKFNSRCCGFNFCIHWKREGGHHYCFGGGGNATRLMPVQLLLRMCAAEALSDSLNMGEITRSWCGIRQKTNLSIHCSSERKNKWWKFGNMVFPPRYGNCRFPYF